MSSTNLLVTGSRNFQLNTPAHNTIETILNSLMPIDHLWEGEANGLDRISKLWALDNKIFVHRFPADWNTFGRSAGPIRNTNMLRNAIQVSKNYNTPLIVQAFYYNVPSKGTTDMIIKALAKGLQVDVHTILTNGQFTTEIKLPK